MQIVVYLFIVLLILLHHSIPPLYHVFHTTIVYIAWYDEYMVLMVCILLVYMYYTYMVLDVCTYS